MFIWTNIFVRPLPEMKLLLLVVALVVTAAADGQGKSAPRLHPEQDEPSQVAEQLETRAVDPFNDITFHLYTRSNPDVPVQVFVGDLGGSSFDPNKPTKFLVHGYNSNSRNGWIIAFKDAFFRTEECNVVAVDWSRPANGPLYNVARGNVNVTGEYLGAFYDFLESLDASLGSMHCMGHSLGAHVCGFSGKAVGGGALGRITGLDPALPLFDFNAPNERLADTDAGYVDVIHTCGGFLGFQAAIGDADFYPNGGDWIQPGCGADVSGGCSHERCHEFFLESIESRNFVARQCGSWEDFQGGSCAENTISLMGNPSSLLSRGTFYLATATERPYALGRHTNK